MSWYQDRTCTNPFTRGDIARVRLLFTEFVHGRGTVPAIRVGAQPYGVLVTKW